MIDKNKKYLIAIDIDETLRDNKGKISKKNIDIIKKVIKKGHIVTICSGRPKEHAMEVAKTIGATDYLICYNGAMVLDQKNQETLFFSKLDKEHLLDLITKCYENDIRVVVTKKDIDYINKDKRHDKQVILNYEEYKKLINDNEFSQCLIIDKDIRKIDEIRKYIINKNNFIIGNHSCFSKISDCYWFSVNNKNSTKGKGLMYLASYLKIPFDNIIAIGNDENDIPMFKVAGIAVAMDNATENVKKEANIITKSNVKSGVAEFLKTLI